MSRMDCVEPVVRMAFSFEDSKICPIGDERLAIQMKEKENLYIIQTSEDSNISLANFREKSRILAYFTIPSPGGERSFSLAKGENSASLNIPLLEIDPGFRRESYHA